MSLPTRIKHFFAIHDIQSFELKWNSIISETVTTIIWSELHTGLAIGGALLLKFFTCPVQRYNTQTSE